MTFDNGAVLRGEFDTRDSHLYTEGNRWFLNAFAIRETGIAFSWLNYSDHTAPDDPVVSQWEHPDIYGFDVSFAADFIRDLESLTLAGVLPGPGA